MSPEGLLHLLELNYPEGGYILLPDLAAPRHVLETTALLENAGVAFVPRDENPPCMPQLCPIEAYWGIIKQEVCKNGWKAITERQLRLSIRRVMLSLNVEVWHNMKEGAPGAHAPCC